MIHERRRCVENSRQTPVAGGPRRRPRLTRQRMLRVLGLATPAADSVTIITAAQVCLRRWRRMIDHEHASDAGDRIRQITEARDVLLRRTCRRDALSRRT